MLCGSLHSYMEKKCILAEEIQNNELDLGLTFLKDLSQLELSKGDSDNGTILDTGVQAGKWVRLSEEISHHIICSTTLDVFVVSQFLQPQIYTLRMGLCSFFLREMIWFAVKREAPEIRETEPIALPSSPRTLELLPTKWRNRLTDTLTPATLVT